MGANESNGEVLASMSTCPKNKSYENLVKHCADLLIQAKLHFFSFVAGILKSYLVTFQTDNPMVPFMFDVLENILNRLLVLIFKKEKIDGAKTIIKKVKVNWFNGEENQLEDDLVDLGAATNDILKKTQVAVEKKRKFRNQCKKMVLNILFKLQERHHRGME